MRFILYGKSDHSEKFYHSDLNVPQNITLCVIQVNCFMQLSRSCS